MAISLILLGSADDTPFPDLNTLAVSIISPKSFGNAKEAAAVMAKNKVPIPNNHRFPRLMYLKRRSDCNSDCFEILVLGSFRSVTGGPAMDAKFCVFYQCDGGR